MNAGPSRVLLVGILTVASLLAGCAPITGAGPTQPAIPVVALMHAGTDHNPPSLQTLVEGLGELGWFDGPIGPVMEQLIGDGTAVNGLMKQLQGQYRGPRIELIWRNLDPNQQAQIDEQAREFVRERVSLIVAFEDKSIRAAQDATADPANRIPVVFLHPSDPVRDHLVATLANPGGNLTGVWGARDPIARQLNYYRQILPALKPLRLLALIDPSDDATTDTLLGEARDAAKQLGITLDERNASTDVELDAAFASVEPGQVDGAFIVSPRLRLYFSSKILALAAAAHLPVQAHRKEWVDPKLIDPSLVGREALFSLGVAVGPVGTAGSRFVDNILKGADPATLPPQEVPKIEFTINLKRAAELGIEVPPHVITFAAYVYR
ncbi:MAG TPA: ABC transporter substrate-binding protein [Candidatus Limnocylindrales bacterium]